MASNLVEALRGAIPLSAPSLLQLPALQPAHASADAGDNIAQPHLLAHAPFAAMLAAEAFGVYCLTRLTLSLVWHPALYVIHPVLTSAHGSASSWVFCGSDVVCRLGAGCLCFALRGRSCRACQGVGEKSMP